MLEFAPFSEKQLTALTWWCRGSPHRNRCALICDGAVRSGKTLCASLSFFSWSFFCFCGQAFALCGKTADTLRRNVLAPLANVLPELGFSYEEKISKGYLDIAFGGRKNRYYLFGAQNELAAARIQGATFAGAFLDEAALMPRSFVEQALARCSVKGARYWFSCNPGHPSHWFYQEWILQAEQKNALYLRFSMQDNPALTQEMLARYQSLYTGDFYRRSIQGDWTAGEGIVYPMFDRARHVFEELPPGGCSRWMISCDYGTVNPCSFGLWGLAEGVWYRVREFYHDARLRGFSLTDEEYYQEMERLAGECWVELVVVDPSAASFIECIRRHGRFAVKGAKNDVVNGIRRVAGALREGNIRFHCSCVDTLREFSLYRYTGKSEMPYKENDHAMDDIRYFVSTVCQEDEEFFALSLSRPGQGISLSAWEKGGGADVPL